MFHKRNWTEIIILVYGSPLHLSFTRYKFYGIIAVKIDVIKKTHVQSQSARYMETLLKFDYSFKLHNKTWNDKKIQYIFIDHAQ